MRRKGGWDTHGLPVEHESRERTWNSRQEPDRELKSASLNSPGAVAKASIATSAIGIVMTERMGYWVDLDDAYFTLTNDYIETVWWLFKQLWDRGLVVAGLQIRAVRSAHRRDAVRSRSCAGLSRSRRSVGLRALPFASTIPRRRSWHGPPRRGRCPQTWRWPCIRRSTYCSGGTAERETHRRRAAARKGFPRRAGRRCAKHSAALPSRACAISRSTIIAGDEDRYYVIRCAVRDDRRRHGRRSRRAGVRS